MTIAKATFDDCTRFVRQWRRPLLVSHTKPDGDALGSLVAVRNMLRQLGISATSLVYEPIPARYAWLDSDQFLVLGKGAAPEELAPFDAVIVLDTCTYNQVEPIAAWLREAEIPKLAVDHHRTRDDLADAYLVDELAAANCLILYDWIKNVAGAFTLDGDLAEALFMGISTDTGWFRHSNTDHRVFAAAADLVSHGVDAHSLFEQLYLCDTEPRVRLLGAALDSLVLECEGRVATMALPAAVFGRTGATRADTEDIINEPLRIISVVVSLLFVEQDDGVIRVSLRSRSPGFGTPDVDVAKIAQGLGGGGHSRAAGLRIPGPLRDAQQRVLAAVASHIGAPNSG